MNIYNKLLATFILSLSLNSYASTISFTYTAAGSGSIDGQAFAASSFILNATGDTENRTVIYSDADIIVYSITHDSASITIDGIGTTNFLVSTRTFYASSQSSNANSGVGFGLGPNGVDLIGKHNNEFIIPSWDMLSSIGPLSFTSQLTAQWQAQTISTDLGVLIFDVENNVATTFQASVVPIPAAIWLFCSGILFFYGFARRQRKSTT